MSEYKDNFIRLIGHKKPKSVAWLVSSEDVELIEKCKATEEVSVGHTIRINNMMQTLAMKRVREILLIHDLKERQKDKNYVDNQLKFTKLVLQSFEEVQD